PCRHLLNRVDTRRDTLGKGVKPNKDARFWAMKRQWDPEIEAFRCAYTDIAMTLDPGSRRSATWEHGTPGVESSVVLVTDLVNKMKADMKEPEFKTMVRALARRFDGEFDESAFPPDPSPS